MADRSRALLIQGSVAGAVRLRRHRLLHVANARTVDETKQYRSAVNDIHGVQEQE